VTATNSFVTAPIARAFGVTHLIATDPEYIGGRYTGKIAGTPSFKHGKVIRVNDWLGAMDRRLGDFEQSYFYSDSLNDLPLLEVVTHPIVTNPSAGLLRVAQERQWPVLNLFNQVVDQKT
jgi:phosphoserine phosphatase